MLKSKRSVFKIVLELIVLATLLLLLIAIWYYRDDVFRSLNDPGKPFQTYVPPKAPDYQLSEHWLDIPDLTIDPELTQGKADIFVVTPTLFLGGEDWVAPIDDPELRADFDRVITPNYVTPYRIAGRVFAPTYRQAALYTFLNRREDARRAQVFAYGDVKRAFDVFLSHHTPERPIILIGHGQGGLHVQKLLKDYFDGERANSLAAAYIIDHPTPVDLVPPSLGICETETDVNCVISFGAFSPKERQIAEDFVTIKLVFEGNWPSPLNGRDIICVNPLLWTRATDYAPARLHKGSVAAEGLEPDLLPAPAPRQFGAQCEEGVLLIDKPKHKSLRRPARFGGRFRTPPYNLFYEDLRENMVTRTQTLIAKDILPKRAPILGGDIDEIVEVPVTLPD